MDHYRVTALGLPASGKSIYLSALHELIGVTALAHGVYFPTDLEESARLRRIYRQASDPDAGWPGKTPVNEPCHESTFTCTVRAPTGTFRLFDVTYIDYPGEWISDGDLAGPVMETFKEYLDSSHALLGVIDGERLLEYLEGDVEGYAFFSERIRPFVERMVAFDGPIHFLITKWDLLRSRYTLLDVKDKLLLSPDATWLRELVSGRADGRRGRAKSAGSVRLIPVSSMGDFARRGDTGEIEKVKGRRPEPFNVEVPLVALVPDLCGWALDLVKEQPHKDEPPAGATVRRTSFAAAQRSVSKAVADTNADGGQVRLTPFGVSVNLKTMVTFAIWLGRPVGKPLGRAAARSARAARRQYRRRRATDLRHVKSTESALFYVTSHVVRKLEAFEEETPGSLFS